MLGGWGLSRTKRPSPANEAYFPKMARGSTKAEPVPERFKHMRLRRRRGRSKDSKADLATTVAGILLVIVCVSVAFAALRLFT